MAKRIRIIPWLDRSEFDKQLNEIGKEKHKINVDVNGSGADDMVHKLHTINSTGTKSTSIFGKLKNAINDTFSSGKLAMTGYLAVLRGIDTAADNAKESIEALNKAETDLMIATDMSRESVQGLMKDYNDYAKQLSSTTKNISDAANDYLRAGKTLEESQALIKDSIMLSKLGDIESGTATEDLLATMNGYEMSINEVDRALDAMVAIDMKAATSAGDLATGLKYSASSANSAGLSYNKLIAILGTVQDKTMMSAEVVGTFANQMLSRYRDITIGKYLTDDGEDISNYESVLKSCGLELRDSQGEFRAFEDVLEEMAGAWDSLTSVQQNALIKVAAGTRQQNRFIALMEGYNKVLELTEVAANSAGTALDKFNTSYMTSLEAKENTLQASFESMIYNSDLDVVYGDILEATTALVDFINQTNALKGVMTSLAVTGGIKTFLTIKTGIHDAYINLNQFQNALNMVRQTNISNDDFDRLLLLTNNLSDSQMRLILSTESLSISQKEDLLVARGLSREEAKLKLQTYGVTEAQTGLTASTTSAKTAMQGFISVLKTNPLLVIATAISAVSMAVSTYKNHLEEVRQATADAATAYKDSASSIDDYVSKYQELREALIAAKGNEEETATVKQQLLELQTELNDKYGEEYGKISLLTSAYEDQTEAIKALNREESNRFLNEHRSGISTATNQMTKERDYVLSAPTLSVGTPDGKALQEIVDSYADEGMRLISDSTTGAVQIVLEADAETAYETLNNFETDLRNKAKELGNENLFDEILDFSSNALEDAKSVVEEYGDIYTQALTAKLVTDDSASEIYNEALTAVEEYNQAVAESEDPFKDGKVAKARANVDAVKAEFANNEELTQFSTLFNDVFEQADTKLIDFHNKLKTDTSLQDWAEQLRGKDIVDLESMVDDGIDDAFDSLVESAEKYGLAVEDVINALIRLGYVQSEVTATNETVGYNTVDLDSLNDQIDSIQSAYKGLTTACEEYNQYGYITADTLQTLLNLDGQYLSCLINENGQLAINRDTYQALVQAKLADAEATAVQQAIDELGAVTVASKTQADVTATQVTAEKAKALAALSGSYGAVATSAAAAAQAEALYNAYESAKGINAEEADRIMSNLNAKLALIQNTAKNTSGSFGALTNHLNGFSDASGKAKDATDELKESLEKQKSVLVDQKSQYEKLYSAVQWLYDKRIKSIDSEIDGIQDLNSELGKQKDILNGIIKAVQNNIDIEINSIQSKIDAIRDANDESEREIALEKAKQDLYKASQKTSLVYTKDKGFIRTEDKKAVSDAQQNLENAQNEVIIEGLEKEIELLEKVKNEWGKVANVREDALNAESAKNYFGDDWRETTLNPSDEMLGSFTNNYVGIQDNIASNEAKIDSLEAEKERIQGLKDLWEDAKNSYRDSQYEAQLASFFGSDYDYQLLNNSATWRKKFASEYADICRQIEEIENQIKSLNEETTSSITSNAEKASGALATTGNALANTKAKAEETGNLSQYIWTDADTNALAFAEQRLSLLNEKVAEGATELTSARDKVQAFVDQYGQLEQSRVVTDELHNAISAFNGDFSETGVYFGNMVAGVSDRLTEYESTSSSLAENTQTTAEQLGQVNEEINNLKTSEETIETEADKAVSEVDTTISNLLTKLGNLKLALENIKLGRTEVETIADEELIDTSEVVDGVHTKVGEIQSAVTTLTEAITPLQDALDGLIEKLNTLDEVTLSNVIGAFGGSVGGSEGEGSGGKSGAKSSAKGKDSKGGEESGGGSGLLGAVKAVDEAIGEAGEEGSGTGLLGKLAQVDASTLENIIAQFGLSDENGNTEGENLLSAVNAVSNAILGEGDKDDTSLITRIEQLGADTTIGHVDKVTTSFNNLLLKIDACITKLDDLASAITNLPSATASVGVGSSTSGGHGGGGRGFAKGGIISKKDSGDLDYIARELGEDHMIAIQEGEAVIPKENVAQNPELVQNLIDGDFESTKPLEYTRPQFVWENDKRWRSMQLAKQLGAFDYLEHNTDIYPKTVTSKNNVPNSTVNNNNQKSTTVEFKGDIILQGVQDQNGLARAIVKKFPMAMEQELHRRH